MMENKIMYLLIKFLPIKSVEFFLVNDMQNPPRPLKSGQIRFLVQKDTQCSETLKKNNFKSGAKYIWEIKVQKYFCIKGALST